MGRKVCKVSNALLEGKRRLISSCVQSYYSVAMTAFTGVNFFFSFFYSPGAGRREERGTLVDDIQRYLPLSDGSFLRDYDCGT